MITQRGWGKNKRVLTAAIQQHDYPDVNGESQQIFAMTVPTVIDLSVMLNLLNL